VSARSATSLRSVVCRAALGLAIVAMLVAPAAARGLRRLHVDALSMRADRTRLEVHQVFHLSIHTHVRERVVALDEIVVPDVGTMLLEGDERRVTQNAGGTDVVETLTLEPVASGTYTFKSAYLDAIDARTGKPSRFSSNPVTVVVGDAVAGLAYPSAAAILRALLGAVFAVLAIVAAVVVVVVVLKNRRRREPAVVTAPQSVPAAPPPPRTSRDAVAEALRAYRSAPANGSLTALRASLFEAAGRNAGATLRDALAATSDRELRAALTAAEHAAFGPAHARDAASAELIGATEAWLR
jgi:hypothetical protein